MRSDPSRIRPARPTPSPGRPPRCWFDLVECRTAATVLRHLQPTPVQPHRPSRLPGGLLRPWRGRRGGSAPPKRTRRSARSAAGFNPPAFDAALNRRLGLPGDAGGGLHPAWLHPDPQSGRGRRHLRDPVRLPDGPRQPLPARARDSGRRPPPLLRRHLGRPVRPWGATARCRTRSTTGCTGRQLLVRRVAAPLRLAALRAPIHLPAARWRSEFSNPSPPLRSGRARRDSAATEGARGRSTQPDDRESLGALGWTRPRSATRATVIEALEAAGGAGCARFVGGCVRNAVLRRPISDVDIATTSPPMR